MSNITTTFRGFAATAGNEVEKSIYAQSSAVAAAIETTILTYTVPVLKDFFIHRVEVSGTNKADYKVKINGVVNGRAYTYYTELSHLFDYTSSPGKGYLISAGDIITVTALHSRPYVGDFSVRLQGLEVS